MDLPDITQIEDEPEYGYKRAKPPEHEIIGKCRYCGEYLTTGDPPHIECEEKYFKSEEWF